ncbi:MAG TPA: ATP-binding protein, partial [Bryobacteraceae bacterium]
ISDSAVRMRALIDDLLTYSQAGSEPASQQIVDLNVVLSWALENLRESIERSGAVITSCTLPSVAGDEPQLGQVFQNLIGNAIKYSRPGVQPVIEITASQKADECVIAIRDNGLGIDNEYFHQIFAPFKRLHGRDIPGTGIGLAMCRRIIEAHGGRIWVESVAGQGSTFSFSFPALIC